MNTHDRLKIASILFLFISTFLLTLSFNPSMNIVHAQETPVERWGNRYNYETTRYNVTHAITTVTTHVGPQVFDDSGLWRELKFENYYATDGYFLIENSHITAKIYDWYTVFLDPDNSWVCVDDERWIVEVWNPKTKKWREVDLYNPSLSYSNNETHLTVTRTFDTYEGFLSVSYIVWQGSRLKHDVVFESRMEGFNEFRVTMKLTGIYHDKVKHSQGEEIVTSETHILSPYFFIGENKTNLILSEHLWSLGSVNETTGEWSSTTLKDIVFNTHASGCKVHIIIGNYTLAENEHLEIDPATSTFQVGGGYDDAYEEGNGNFWLTLDRVNVYSYHDPEHDNYDCGGFRFPTVNILQNATVSSATFSGYTKDSPYLGDEWSLWSAIYGNDVDDAQDFNDLQKIISTGDRPRTSASVNWDDNELPELSWQNKTGLQGIVGEVVARDGWSSGNALVLLFIADVTGFQGACRFYSYETDSSKAAKLYVTYTSPTPTNDACDSDSVFVLNVYRWVNMTVSDADGVADLKTVDTQVNTTGDAETFTLRWTQSSDSFSEVSDTSNICTLDASGSVRTNIDSDTDKIAFRFKFTSGTAGSCDVRANSTDDSDFFDTDTYENEFTLSTNLNLQARDYEGNILTEATIYMDNGTEYSQTVNSQGWANWTSITAATVNVYAKWYGYLVNSTFQITMDTDKTVNVTCRTYPLTLDGTRYWIAGNATISTYSWNSTTKKFVLSFSGSTNNYTLKSSATSQPTYILNVTYDIDTDWSTYLTLSHYGNRTITIAYPNWASTRIYRTDDTITNTYWASTGEKLHIILSGTTNQSGTLEVYCGSRGVPQSTTNLADPVYFSGTTILSGTYTFTSTVTVEVDWTTETGGSSGGSRTTPSIFATAQNIELGNIQQGTSKEFNATATWTGSTTITLIDVSFSGDGADWLHAEVDAPLTIKRLAIETSGTIQVPLTLTIPREAQLGDYKILIAYKIAVGTKTYETTANISWSVTSTPILPGPITQLVSIVLLISLVGIVLFGIKKRGH